jgi:hypothetical protein
MSFLFLRTLSQGLQAFVPIAASAVWFNAVGARRMAAAVRLGLLISVPATVVAARLFQTSSYRAQDELALAACATVVAFLLAWTLWRPAVVTSLRTSTRPLFWGVSASAVVIIVRQTMEIGAVLEAALELRSFDATLAIVTGAATSVTLAGLWAGFGHRLSGPVLRAATRAFAVAFVAQLVLYTFHESAEARLLPYSEALHAATEPYGPDGLYGVHFSDLLILAPLVAAAWSLLRGLVPNEQVPRWRLVLKHRLAASGAVLAGVVLFMGTQRSDAEKPAPAPAASPAEIAAMTARPHVIFRSTSPGPAFGRLSVAPLDSLDRRESASLSCERVSFSGRQGLCLHTDRSLFNSHTAYVFDQTLKSRLSIRLQGLPSRTRIASSGGVGAITVFVIGDNYAAQFSTRTTVVDMATGDEIGELEQFTTWREGARFRAIDFNFWGVTFLRDGNIFYASLRTAGKTYLVRGELLLRKLTVIREGVECPSLSPDNRLLAYKKRVGPSPDAWRLHVLDLTTNVERMIGAETRYIDDQVEWLDERHVLYGIPRRTTAISDVWVASIDGNEAARVFLPEAESPIIVR